MVIKTGQAHSPALVAVRYKLDARRIPTVWLSQSESFTPEFDISVLVRDGFGRDIETVMTVGPDNVSETGVAIRLWEALTLEWQGKLRR